jgi:hypothetical protein
MHALRSPAVLLRPRLVALLAAILLGFAGCETAPSSATSSSDRGDPPGWVALERTPGNLPEAPAYVVTLFEDGKVLFEGATGVPRKGTATKRIPADHAARVFARLEEIDLWALAPRYDYERANRGMDSVIVAVAPQGAPSDILTAQRRHRFKRIDGLFFAPRELLDFKKLLEETVGLAEWLASPPPAAPP